MSKQPSIVRLAAVIEVPTTDLNCKETDEITRALQELGFSVTHIEWTSIDSFKAEVQGKKFSVLYLGAHADAKGFGHTADNASTSWEDFALALCTSECVAPDGILFMGCCRGGMKTVAIKLMLTCDKVAAIFGPNCNIKSSALRLAFRTFTQARYHDETDISEACKRATAGADREFCCFDRQQLETELDCIHKLQVIYDTQFTVLSDLRTLTYKVSLLMKAVAQLTQVSENRPAEQQAKAGPVSPSPVPGSVPVAGPSPDPQPAHR